MPPMRSSPNWTLQQRLHYRSVRDTKTGCVLWTGSRNATGYGYINIGGRTWYTHRAAWTAANGSIRKGLHVCNRCDERACINPDHLFLGSHKDNMADRAAKARQRKAGAKRAGARRRPVRGSEIMRVIFRGEEVVSRVLRVQRY